MQVARKIAACDSAVSNLHGEYQYNYNNNQDLIAFPLCGYSMLQMNSKLA